MLNENAKLWLEALESGKFLQRTGGLYKEGKYCCLGVGKKLAEDAGVKVSESKLNWFISDDVVNWLGLVDNAGRALSQDLPSCVALNDSMGKTFPEIAAHLREHQDKYFVQRECTHAVR